MSALFGRVIKQVFNTFDRQNASAFNGNFKMLQQLVDQLTARDLNIENDILSETTFNQPEKAPCTYIHIFQNNDVAMSVFVLRGDYTMPLHDHPMMHGILKGISGSLLVQSYTRCNAEVDENSIVVAADPVKTVSSTSQCTILTPKEGNFHEIMAVGGVAAFFDILSPPYEADIPVYGKRKCNFYRKIAKKTSNELILEKIPVPISYYCDSIDYEPPDFLKVYLCKNDLDNI